MRLLLLAAALAAFSAPLGAAPSAAEVAKTNLQLQLAFKQYEQKDLAGSEATLKKALQTIPDHPRANLLLGIIRCLNKKFKEAVEPLKIAARETPPNLDAFNNLGIAYFQLEQWAEAETAFKKVAELKPDRVDAWMNLGVLGLRLKKWKPAQEAFKKAAALAPKDPKSAKAYMGAAEAADNAGDRDGNIHALKSALELSPQDKMLRLSLGQKLYRAERNEEAVGVLEELKGKGEPEAEFLLGCVYYKRGRFDDSRERFETALAAKPDYPEALFNLAITLYDQGRYADAIQQFERVLAKHPKDQQAKSNLEITRRAAVRSHLKGGSQDFLQADYLSALDKWKKALQLEPENKVIKDLVETAQKQLEIQAEEFAVKGDLAFQSSKVEEAVLGWGQALERNPDNATAKAGMEKVKSEAKKLTEIYTKEFKARLAEEDFPKARDLAKRLLGLDKKAGQKAEKDWKAQAGVKAASLAKEAAAAKAKGALHDAVEKLERAAALVPEDSALQLKSNQAKVEMRQETSRAFQAGKDAEAAKQWAKAHKEYKRVLELDPANGEAKDKSREMAKLAKAKAVDPAELDEWYYQGVYAYAAGDTTKAMGFWGKVLGADPGHRLASEAVKRANKRLKALSGSK